MATIQREIATVFGLAPNDREATAALLRENDLFDDLDLFAHEHGIQALLPFLRRFFPWAKIVLIAISYGATCQQCDRAVALLEKFIVLHTPVVQSTDYSHYLPIDVPRQRDQETLKRTDDEMNDVDTQWFGIGFTKCLGASDLDLVWRCIHAAPEDVVSGANKNVNHGPTFDDYAA